MNDCPRICGAGGCLSFAGDVVDEVDEVFSASFSSPSSTMMMIVMSSERTSYCNGEPRERW
jgi:hypothetical protein